MKHTLSLTLALLTCLTLLAACAKTEPAPQEQTAPEPQQQTPPTETPAPAPEEPRVLTYEIERTDRSEELPVELYLEIPVFAGDSDAARAINAAFDEVKRAWLDGEAAEVQELVRESMGDGYGPTADAPYTSTHSAAVTTCDETLVSVAIYYDWFMGGVLDYGMHTYNFDAATGAPLTLRDLLSGTDDALREAIAEAFETQYPDAADAGVMDTPADVIRAMPIEDFSFYVEDGAVHVFFSKYEITYGAAGAFDVLLPEALAR